VQPTDFVDDEYVIYRTVQQYMCYLVEFSDETDALKPTQPLSVPIQAPVKQAHMLIPTEDYTVQSSFSGARSFPCFCDVIIMTDGDATFPRSGDEEEGKESQASEKEKGDEQDQEAGLMSKGDSTPCLKTTD